jgi:hypothetical protein
VVASARPCEVVGAPLTGSPQQKCCSARRRAAEVEIAAVVDVGRVSVPLVWPVVSRCSFSHRAPSAPTPRRCLVSGMACTPKARTTFDRTCNETLA